MPPSRARIATRRPAGGRVGDPAPRWRRWPHDPGRAGRIHRGSRGGTPDSQRAVPPAWSTRSLLGWDQQRPAWNAESYVHRLSAADRAQSTAAPGTPDGRLSLLYRFENEQLSERRNGTVHAFSSLSIRPAPG